MLLVKWEKKYSPRSCGRPCARQQEAKHTGGEQQWEKGNGNQILVFRSQNVKRNQMSFLAACLTSPSTSPNLYSRLQPKIQRAGGVTSHRTPHSLSWVLFSSDIGEECILGGYNPWPLNKILEMPYSFPPTLFQILSKWAVPSFRKFFICAFLCLLSQIQPWYPALVCTQTHPLFALYCYTVKVNTSNTCTMKKHFYLFKQDLEGVLSFTQAGGDSKERPQVDKGRQLRTNLHQKPQALEVQPQPHDLHILTCRPVV